MAEKIEIKPKPLSGAFSTLLGTSSNRSNGKTAGVLSESYLSIGLDLLVGTIAFTALSILIKPDFNLLKSTLIGLILTLTIFIFSAFSTQFYYLYKQLSDGKYIIYPEGIEILESYPEKNKTKIPFSKIKDAKIEKPLPQRLFGTANVKLDTVGPDQGGERIEFVSHADVLKEELSSMISHGDEEKGEEIKTDDEISGSQGSSNGKLEPNLKAGLIANTATGIIGISLVIISSYISLFINDLPVRIALPASLLIGGLVFAYMTARQYFKLKATEYRFSDHNLEIHRGVLKQKSETLPYNSIKDISVKRSRLDRILDTGTVMIKAGNNTYEGSIPFVKHPEQELEKIKKAAGTR